MRHCDGANCFRNHGGHSFSPDVPAEDFFQPGFLLLMMSLTWLKRSWEVRWLMGPSKSRRESIQKSLGVLLTVLYSFIIIINM